MTRHVTPKERNLETPPDGSEGEIRDVEFDRVDDRYEGSPPKACQYCESPVDRAKPHVWMHGWQENSAGHKVHFRPVFCDKDCWAAWAGRD